MNEKYLIRTAVLSDLQSILEIYNSTIPGRIVTGDLIPVTVEERLHWLKAHTTDYRPLWVLEKDKTILAWLGIQPFNEKPAFEKTTEVSIYVAKDFRRMGIGSIMLNYVIQNSSKINVKTLIGLVFAHNVASLKLFEKFGFNKWAYMPGVAELDSIERDLIIMGYRVKP